MKNIDLNATVYNLTKENPELIAVLAEIGFSKITNSVARQTIGRKMTLVQGIKNQGRSVDVIKRELKTRGFNVKVSMSNECKI